MFMCLCFLKSVFWELKMKLGEVYHFIFLIVQIYPFNKISVEQIYLSLYLEK